VRAAALCSALPPRTAALSPYATMTTASRDGSSWELTHAAARPASRARAAKWITTSVDVATGRQSQDMTHTPAKTMEPAVTQPIKTLDWPARPATIVPARRATKEPSVHMISMSAKVNPAALEALA
jgi:hypothetical protein